MALSSILALFIFQIQAERIKVNWLNYALPHDSHVDAFTLSVTVVEDMVFKGVIKVICSHKSEALIQYN